MASADFELTESDRQEIQRLVAIESFRPIVDSLTDSTKDLVSNLEDVFRNAAALISDAIKNAKPGGGDGDENKSPQEPKPKPSDNRESKFNLANIFSRGEAGAGAAASGDAVGLASFLPGIGGSLGMVGAAGFAAAGALVGLTKAATAAGKAYAQFSPSLSLVQAQSDIRGMFRDMQIGEAIAPDIAKLTEALDDLKDAAVPLVIAATKIAAWLATRPVNAAANAAIGINEGVENPQNIPAAVWRGVGELPWVLGDAISAIATMNLETRLGHDTKKAIEDMLGMGPPQPPPPRKFE